MPCNFIRGFAVFFRFFVVSLFRSFVLALFRPFVLSLFDHLVHYRRVQKTNDVASFINSSPRLHIRIQMITTLEWSGTLISVPIERPRET
jgi:hypothetical protein